MRSTITILVLVLGILSVAPSDTEAVIVTINPAQLPTSSQASYVQAWAAAGSTSNYDLCSPLGKTDSTGAKVECHNSKTSGGNSSTADATAEVIGGVGTLTATTSAVKSTFAAAAAYAKGGATVQKSGQLKGTVVSLVLGGLKVSGNIDPIDTIMEIEVSNLAPNELNQRLLQATIHDKSLNPPIKDLPKGLSEKNPTQTFFRFKAEVSGDGALQVSSDAPFLCDHEPGMSLQAIADKADKICIAKKNFTPKEAFKEVCKDKATQDAAKPKECKTKGIRLFENQEKITFTFFIPEDPKFKGKKENVNFSVDIVEYTKSRDEKRQMK